MKAMKRLMYIPLLMTICSSSWASLGGMVTMPNIPVKHATHKHAPAANHAVTRDMQYISVSIMR